MERGKTGNGTNGSFKTPNGKPSRGRVPAPHLHVTGEITGPDTRPGAHGDAMTDNARRQVAVTVAKGVELIDSASSEGHAGVWCFEKTGGDWKNRGREVHVSIELATGKMRFSQYAINGQPDRSRGTKPAA
jgi:hypothetical protein